MPTSATGTEFRDEAGFTLVELMIVIVIMGLMASIVVMTVGDGRPSLAAEVDQFSARLNRAKEEAVLTNRPVGVEVTTEGYAFRVRRKGRWEELKEGPFKPVVWSEGLETSTDQPGPVAQVNFEATGAAEPLRVTLSRKSKQVDVTVDAAGNVRVDAAG